MSTTASRIGSGGFVCLAMMAMAVAITSAPTTVTAQSGTEPATSEVPDLVGVWDGGGRARPVNGPNMPWTSENFPVLNERALAYQAVFDEALAPKYDCVPSAPPALQYNPYFMEVVQWPDRCEIMPTIDRCRISLTSLSRTAPTSTCAVESPPATVKFPPSNRPTVSANPSDTLRPPKELRANTSERIVHQCPSCSITSLFRLT